MIGIERPLQGSKRELERDKRADFILLYRTKNLSPTILIFNIAEFSTMELPEVFLSQIGSEIFGAIKAMIDDRREKRELYQSLFGFTLNADFITSRVEPKTLMKDGIWGITDYYAALKTVSFLSSGFVQRPEIDRHNERDLTIDYSRNIVSLGGPCNNAFSQWILEPERPKKSPPPEIIIEDYPEVPFKFGYEIINDPCKVRHSYIARNDDKCGTIYKPELYYKESAHENAEEISLERVCSIKKQNKENEEKSNKIIIPKKVEDIKPHRICKMDYGMILKVRSAHKEGKMNGKWCLMIAGCHGGGTLGAAQALGDTEILRKIFDKVGLNEFQAIVSVETKTDVDDFKIEGERRLYPNDSPKKIRLLEVEQIRPKSKVRENQSPSDASYRAP